MDTVRDIAIIFLAALHIVWMLLVCAIAFVIWRLFVLVKKRAPHLLDQVNDIAETGKSIADTGLQTARSARGTVDFAGETAVMPLIRFVSFLAALGRFLSVLMKGERNRP